MSAPIPDLETTLHGQIEAVDARLSELAEAIQLTGVVVTGSRGQPRANVLLTQESVLRRERTQAIAELEDLRQKQATERRLDAELELANSLTRWAPERLADNASRAA
jgi:uncharacterized protein involved in exopolysaccharide biosynthesis